MFLEQYAGKIRGAFTIYRFMCPFLDIQYWHLFWGSQTNILRISNPKVILTHGRDLGAQVGKVCERVWWACKAATQQPLALSLS